MQSRVLLRAFVSLAILAGTLAPAATGPALATGPVTHDIATCADLQTLGADGPTASDNINLTADLDCTGIDFQPLYTGGQYTGAFNGQGHSISHLTINHPSSQRQALFAWLNGASVENLTLASGMVAGVQFVGGLAGQAQSVSISNVTSRLNLSGTEVNMFGGLIGYLGETQSSLLQDVTVTGNVVATTGFLGSSYVGGLVGGVDANDHSTVNIRRAAASGHVDGGSNGRLVGGLIGRAFAFANTGASDVNIQDSYAAGNVDSSGSSSSIGGLVGEAGLNGAGSDATVNLTRTYASGDVVGWINVGGLVGTANGNNNQSFLNVTNSFAVGAVTSGSGNEAGLVGGNNMSAPDVATSTNSFYDGPGTGQTDCAGNLPLAGTCTRVDTGVTPAYFKGNHTSPPLDVWDFAGTWITNPGAYPTLIPDDTDGTDRTFEQAAPNSGDANADGILDASQSNVASFPNVVTGHYSVLQSSCGTLAQVIAAREPGGSNDVAYDYPAGMIGFVITGCTPGATATITQYYYGSYDASTLVMRKWVNGNIYTALPGSTLTNVTIGGQTALKAVYQVTDGSSLDDDGAIDGNISDPAGPAVRVLGAPNTGLGALNRE